MGTLAHAVAAACAVQKLQRLLVLRADRTDKPLMVHPTPYTDLPTRRHLVSQNVVIEHNLFEDCQTPIGMSAGSGQHINYRSHHNSLGLSGLHVAEYGAPTGSAFFFGGGIQNFRSDHDRVYRSLPGASGTVYYCSNEYGNNLVSFDNLSVQDGIWAPDNMDGIQNRLGASANNRYDSGDSLSLLGESNARVVFSTTQRNAGLNAGRLRLIYSQAISNEYIYQSSKYLIRLTTGGGNTSYKESLFLFSLSKPYEGNMSVQVNVLEGTPDAKLVMVSTLGGRKSATCPHRSSLFSQRRKSPRSTVRSS